MQKLKKTKKEKVVRRNRKNKWSEILGDSSEVINPYIPKRHIIPRSDFIYDLSIGVPDPFDPVDNLEELPKRSEKGYNFAGTPELKELISEFLKLWDLEIESNRIIVTAGATGAYDLLISQIQRGEFFLLKPYFSLHLKRLEADGSIIHTGSSEDLEEIVNSGKMPIVVMNFPNNPSGCIITPTHKEEKLFNRVPLIIDLTYLPLLPYKDILKHQNYLMKRSKKFLSWLKEATKRGNTILIGSLSKVFYPGLRIGWLILPKGIDSFNFMGSIVEKTSGISIESDIKAQHLLKKVLNDKFLLLHRIIEVNETIQHAIELLKEADLLQYVVEKEPGGAYYLLFNAKQWLNEMGIKCDGKEAENFIQERVLNTEKATIYVVKGSIFGLAGTIRLSLGKTENIGGIKAFIENLKEFENKKHNI